MIFLLFGKPLVLWIGFLALISFSLQIYLGTRMAKGHPELFKYHRINAMVLCGIVIVHLVLGLLLYF
jgi:hypothetical protein